MVRAKIKKILIGIDEVGRGPLAGPVTVAAVSATLNSKYKNANFQKLLKGIKDSKKLSAKQREEWNWKIKTYKIKHKAFNLAIASVGPKIIDRIGVVNAARLATGRCLKKLSLCYAINISCFKILLDGGLHAPKTFLNQETIIKGDEKVPIIAAASIIAKVYRDKKMIKLHKDFPWYGFDLHKGYGTKIHREAIKKYGLSEIHRSSFCKNLV